jgi:hypothetical protein
MTTVKEERTPTEGEVGPSFDFYLKPLRKLKRCSRGNGSLPSDE